MDNISATGAVNMSFFDTLLLFLTVWATVVYIQSELNVFIRTYFNPFPYRKRGELREAIFASFMWYIPRNLQLSNLYMLSGDLQIDWEDIASCEAWGMEMGPIHRLRKALHVKNINVLRVTHRWQIFYMANPCLQLTSQVRGPTSRCIVEICLKGFEILWKKI